jgi:hypothetical protein
MMLYVEDSDGHPIDGNRAAEIRKVSRSLFVQFASAGVAPKTWTATIKPEMGEADASGATTVSLKHPPDALIRPPADTLKKSKVDRAGFDVETASLVNPTDTDTVDDARRREKGKGKDTSFSFEVCLFHKFISILKVPWLDY